MYMFSMCYISTIEIFSSNLCLHTVLHCSSLCLDGVYLEVAQH